MTAAVKAAELGREIKRTVRCERYGHLHSWIVWDGEWHIQQEVPAIEGPVLLACYLSSCGLEDGHCGSHDGSRRDGPEGSEPPESPLSDGSF